MSCRQGLENFRGDRFVQQAKLHVQGVAAGLRAFSRAHDAASVIIEPECMNLRAIALCVDTEAWRCWQAGVGHARQIGRFRADA